MASHSQAKFMIVDDLRAGKTVLYLSSGRPVGACTHEFLLVIALFADQSVMIQKLKRVTLSSLVSSLMIAIMAAQSWREYDANMRMAS